MDLSGRLMKPEGMKVGNHCSLIETSGFARTAIRKDGLFAQNWLQDGYQKPGAYWTSAAALAWTFAGFCMRMSGTSAPI